MAIQLKLLVITVFLGCTILNPVMAEEQQKAKFNGNFLTKQIRELWQVCSITFQTNHPQLDQALRWEVCDCYTDLIRRTLTPDKLGKLDYKQAKELSSKLINECNVKLNKQPIIT